ncbi:MAG: rhodanese-like domain-containing protein [Eggerthellaceae bacterium]|nr:rhodanese-like domain-containing protein [Eggerthellaceae bacterium]
MRAGVEKISASAAAKMVEEDGALLIDVRPMPLYGHSHVRGAVSMPFALLDRETAAATIPAFDTPVVVYCEMGVLSEMAAQTLVEMGYSDVCDAGSIYSWPEELVSLCDGASEVGGEANAR